MAAAVAANILGFPGPATGVIWALRAQMTPGKRVRKWVPGASRPGGPKSRKRSRKRVKIVEKQSILTLFQLRLRLFGRRGREAPGTHCPTLFPTLGPEGPNDPCSGQKFSQQTLPNQPLEIQPTKWSFKPGCSGWPTLRPSNQIFSGPQKGPVESGHVTKCQKVSKIFFDTFATFFHAGQKTSKIDKDIFRQFSCSTNFASLLGGREIRSFKYSPALILWKDSGVFLAKVG